MRSMVEAVQSASSCPSGSLRSPPPPSRRGRIDRIELLGGLRHLLEVSRVFEVHWRVQLERILEAEFLADLAHRRHDLLPQQADAGARVSVADRAVIAPDAVDRRA